MPIKHLLQLQNCSVM